ncbi:hypothetical protein CERSUDRAFT_100604 [Gelatoporia subvermispora B]|uniref:Uncharacterized protein n=1 Tax=Ceriporiopsis subvermispora (strain B) TaxID=914234 RepID=M2P7E6_CERS8|nr:hypothetical protein CERSUDRAFT_100604 [Gelatoporia subvermispora B]
MDLLRPNLTPRVHPLLPWYGSDAARASGSDPDVSSDVRDAPAQVCTVRRAPSFLAAAGYDTDYHPSQLHPPRPKEDVEREAQEKAGEDAREEDEHGTGADGEKGGEKGQGEKHKKAGFMEKMKGEAKSLLGKVEGKGHKKGEA